MGRPLFQCETGTCCIESARACTNCENKLLRSVGLRPDAKTPYGMLPVVEPPMAAFVPLKEASYVAVPPLALVIEEEIRIEEEDLLFRPSPFPSEAQA